MKKFSIYFSTLNIFKRLWVEFNDESETKKTKRVFNSIVSSRIICKRVREDLLYLSFLLHGASNEQIYLKNLAGRSPADFESKSHLYLYLVSQPRGNREYTGRLLKKIRILEF